MERVNKNFIQFKGECDINYIISIANIELIAMEKNKEGIIHFKSGFTININETIFKYIQPILHIYRSEELQTHQTINTIVASKEFKDAIIKSKEEKQNET